MSKLSKFLKSDAGQLLTGVGIAYAKKQSANAREVAPVIEPLIKTEATGENVNPFVFAMSLIRAPFLQKLKDRTYQVLITTAFTATTGTFAAWQTAGLPVSDKLNLTFVALGAWAAVGAAFTISDKNKDATIAKAAIEASASPTQQTLPMQTAVQTVELTPTEPMTDDVATRLNQAAVLEQETYANR